MSANPSVSPTPESAPHAAAAQLLLTPIKNFTPGVPFVFMAGPEVDDAFGWGKSSRWAAIGRGEFTQPVKIGAKSLWPSHEIEHILAARLRGATDDELRALVTTLHERRGGAMPPEIGEKRKAVVDRLLDGKRRKKAMHAASKANAGGAA
ncbi:hypothetical protein E4T66_13590 [Sinimarinibacterium sp. CAU 1509]|uniref:helix-turn-helix transcriptional regulator n=1 Tax=Sinimarinibacterium sp. CAU 1509 TaxID=2562283 RepID=UPI0010ACC6D2|nr:hypothetical protein [Sinimarinibacterium sp. CAU 1509]TJY59418.1 hypothetical protein E4T66_13590 [Sinimarinibacterium sp. CAU 1509]